MITKNNKKIICLYFIIGILLRCVLLGAHPIGLHQDEVYSGYEAWALLNYGVDSNGYSWPLYFVSWGSGMNVLYSYLSIPFIKLFGLTAFSIRIVQCIFGCLSLVIFYKLLQEIKPEIAEIGLLIFAINPWHILMSRWGIESNLAPFFLLLGTYSIVKYIKGNKQFALLAALAFGLSLYTYAIMWFFVPIYLISIFIYMLYCKEFKIDKELIGAIVVLFLFALPLFLFLAVQLDIIDEFTFLCFSLPKLPIFRGGEVAGSFAENLSYLFDLFVLQNGYPNADTAKICGNYYFVLVPFTAYGAIVLLKDFKLSLKKRKISLLGIIFVWLTIAFCITLTIAYVNTNKANAVHIPIVILTIIGVYELLLKMPSANKKRILTGVLCVAFATFIVPFSIFNESYRLGMIYDYEKVIDYAIEEIPEDKEIYVAGIYHSHILFHTQESPMDFANGFIRDEFYGKELLTKAIHQHVRQYKNFIFEIQLDEIPKEGAYYIFPNYSVPQLEQNYGLGVIYQTTQFSILTKAAS